MSADLDRLTDQAERLLQADVPWGVLTERPTQRALFRASLQTSIDRDVVLVAEADDGGAPVGYLLAQTGNAAAWMAPMVDATPVAYLSALYVEPSGRAAGVGGALAAAGHRYLDGKRMAVVLLHYALPSPVSAPFWSRMGYRPLWTLWTRRPAVRRLHRVPARTTG